MYITFPSSLKNLSFVLIKWSSSTFQDFSLCEPLKTLSLSPAEFQSYMWNRWTFTNTRTFKNHISLVHHDNFPALSDPSETDINDPSPQPSEHSEAETNDGIDIDVVSRMASSSAANEIVPNLVSDHSALQRSHALFLLGLKEKHKLTQVAIQDIIQSVTDITQQGLSVLKSQVCSVLAI